jgi:cellulose synthase/poly-beta-1,6-N-acetylglucosamine synthase-like glycosyltransferase
MVVTPSLILLILFAIFSGLQLFYYLYFFVRLAFYKNKIQVDFGKPDPVSVIICAFNEEANLRKICLYGYNKIIITTKSLFLKY